jgi:predicted metal-binding membrane protein
VLGQGYRHGARHERRHDWAVGVDDARDLAPPYLLLLWAMWAAMMAGMMLPPVILLAAHPVERGDAVVIEGADARLYGLVGAYLAVWTVFSVGATGLQFAAQSHLRTEMMEPASRTVMAALLLVAGVSR